MIYKKQSSYSSDQITFWHRFPWGEEEEMRENKIMEE